MNQELEDRVSRLEGLVEELETKKTLEEKLDYYETLIGVADDVMEDMVYRIEHLFDSRRGYLEKMKELGKRVKALEKELETGTKSHIEKVYTITQNYITDLDTKDRTYKKMETQYRNQKNRLNKRLDEAEEENKRLRRRLAKYERESDSGEDS